MPGFGDKSCEISKESKQICLGWPTTVRLHPPGFASGSTPTSDFMVGLGSFSDALTSIPTLWCKDASLSPGSDEAGVKLTFAALPTPDDLHGPVLEHIVLTETCTDRLFEVLDVDDDSARLRGHRLPGISRPSRHDLDCSKIFLDDEKKDRLQMASSLFP